MTQQAKVKNKQDRQFRKGTIEENAVGQPLTVHPEYAEAIQEAQFFDLSYRGGRKYKEGVDANKDTTFIFHPRELDEIGKPTESAKNRKKLAVYRNFCKPIVQEHIDFVFKQPVRRPENASYVDFIQDADMEGTPLKKLVRRAMLWAAIHGRRYLVMDSTKAEGETATETARQDEELGTRVFLSEAGMMRLINWERYQGKLVDAVFLWDGGTAIRYTENEFTFYALDEEDGVTVKSIQTVQHDFKAIPVVELAPFDGESLLCDIAEVNKHHFNISSWIDEEAANHAFTQITFIGVSKDELTEGSLTVGSNKALAIPNDKAQIDRSGGDASVLQVLSELRSDDVAEIFRLVGLRDPSTEPPTQAESGVAIRMKLFRVEGRLCSIAEEAQEAEDTIQKLWSNGDPKGTPLDGVNYPDSFDVPEFDAELNRTLSALSSELPPTLKRLEVERYANLAHPNMTEEQRNAIAAELDEVLERKEEMSQARLDAQRALTQQGTEDNQDE